MIIGRKCVICLSQSKNEDIDLPGLEFTFLEGSPFVCELCHARALGIEASWIEMIENSLKEKEIG